MKIVRILWGNYDKILKEIPESPVFNDEIVLVWGIDNNRMLLNRGYKTILLSEEISDPEFDGVLNQFGHKILALSRVEEIYNEYLFLDWDVVKVKEIDNSFYEKIRSAGKISCPLYSYPNDYAKLVYSVLKEKNELKDHKDYIINQHLGINLYSWKLDKDLILPCFCFFYSSINDNCKKLLEIARKKKLNTNIEEFAMFIYSDCSLDDYIRKHEPLVIRGKENNDSVKWMDDSIKRTNAYIDNKIKKDIYLLNNTL
jgi:hypothetical protein